MPTTKKPRQIKMSWGKLGQIRIRTNRHSDAVHNGITDMLKHLKATNKTSVWKGLVDGADVLSLYNRYQRGELGEVIFAEQIITAKTLMLEWAANLSSPTTRKSYTECINNLFRDHPDAAVAELPEVLKAVRERYRVKGQNNSFDQCRKVASSWAGKKYYNNFTLWRQLRDVPPLDVNSHKHEQVAREVWQVFACVKKMGEPFGRQFLTMALSGMGTKEFLQDGFRIERDETHGYDYIHVLGAKREHRTRRVPLIFKADTYVQPTVTLANRRKFDEALQAVEKKWDLYDARRSFVHWCEEAGINHLRALAYSGHLAKTVDEGYRRHNIDPHIQNDADRLRDYIVANMKKPEPRKDIPELPALPDF